MNTGSPALVSMCSRPHRQERYLRASNDTVTFRMRNRKYKYQHHAPRPSSYRRTRRPGRVLCACAGQGAAFTIKPSVVRRAIQPLPKFTTLGTVRTCHDQCRSCQGTQYTSVRPSRSEWKGVRCAVCGQGVSGARKAVDPSSNRPSQTTVLFQDCDIASPHPLPLPSLPVRP